MLALTTFLKQNSFKYALRTCSREIYYELFLIVMQIEYKNCRLLLKLYDTLTYATMNIRW